MESENDKSASALPVLEDEERLGDQAGVRRSLSLITWEGSFATVFIVLTGGAFLTGLALLFGANDFEIGLLAAIPFLAQLAQLVAAYLVDLTGKRKTITLWSIGLARQAWWVLLPLPLLKGDWRLPVMLLVVVLSNLATMMATAGWMSWVADLVPDRIRGRYFGNRSAVIAAVSITTTLIGGFILDHFRNAGNEGAGFSIITGIGCLFALIALVFLGKLPRVQVARSAADVSWVRLLEPLRNKSFRHLLKIFVFWNFALGIAAAFFAAHMLTNLKMTFTQIALYASLAALVAVLLNKPWGMMIDRFGSKPVIVLCAFGIAFVPMIWWIPRAGYLWILVFEAIYSGSLWTGFSLAAFNIPIANSPREGRTIYLAMFSVVTGLAFFAASVIGGALAENWRPIRWHLGQQTIVNYHILFAISTVLRLLAAFVALGFHEPTEKGLPSMIQFMGNSLMRWLSVGRQFLPWSSKMIPSRFLRTETVCLPSIFTRKRRQFLQ